MYSTHTTNRQDPGSACARPLCMWQCTHDSRDARIWRRQLFRRPKIISVPTFVGAKSCAAQAPQSSLFVTQTRGLTSSGGPRGLTNSGSGPFEALLVESLSISGSGPLDALLVESLLEALLFRTASSWRAIFSARLSRSSRNLASGLVDVRRESRGRWASGSSFSLSQLEPIGHLSLVCSGVCAAFWGGEPTAEAVDRRCDTEAVECIERLGAFAIAELDCCRAAEGCFAIQESISSMSDSCSTDTVGLTGACSPCASSVIMALWLQPMLLSREARPPRTLR